MKDISKKKIFYIGTIISVLIFTIGIIITIVHNPCENSVINFFKSNYFDEITMFIPFSIWAWLIIFAILFVKKKLGCCYFMHFTRNSTYNFYNCFMCFFIQSIRNFKVVCYDFELWDY